MHPRLPVILSFLLPGLGQLYVGRFARSVALFTAFTLLSLSARTRWLIPLVLAVSTWEAHREGATTPGAPAKRAAYLVTGFTAFLAWMSLLAVTWLPHGDQGYLNAAADRAAREIRECARRLGREPQSVEECAVGPGRWPNDAWGSPLGYRRGERGFEIRAAGRDGRWDSADDFIYRFAFER